MEIHRTKSAGSRRLTAKLFDFLFSGADSICQADDDFPIGCSGRESTPFSSASRRFHSDRHLESGVASPYDFSPWNTVATTSPFAKSPWAFLPILSDDLSGTGLIGTLVRDEGHMAHIYSLAAARDLLYIGSDSKNIRVWKGYREISGFRSSSGLVKTIIVAGDRVFTGHQDGKIRIWKTSSKNPQTHKRIGTLPRLTDIFKSSVGPSNYGRVRRQRKALWVNHFDAVSCLTLDAEAGILYSGSWDKSVKTWRISDSKFLGSIKAHNDAVNSVATGFGGYVFTGSADGTVKVWRREAANEGDLMQHVLVQTLLRQRSAVTAVAVAGAAGAVYSGSSDGAVNYWRWEGARLLLAHGEALRGHRLAVLCLAVNRAVVVSGSADRTLCVWQREEAIGRHTKLAVFVGHEGPVKSVVMVKEEEEGEIECSWAGAEPSLGRRYVVYSGSLDRSIKVWRVREWQAKPEVMML